MGGKKNDRREREEGEPVKSELPHPDNKQRSGAQIKMRKMERQTMTESKQEQIAGNKWRGREIKQKTWGTNAGETGARDNIRNRSVNITSPPSLRHLPFPPFSPQAVTLSNRTTAAPRLLLPLPSPLPCLHFPCPSSNINLSLMSCEYKRGCILAPCLHLPTKLPPLCPTLCCLSKRLCCANMAPAPRSNWTPTEGESFCNFRFFFFFLFFGWTDRNISSKIVTSRRPRWYLLTGFWQVWPSKSQ